jgi:putative hydrolase of the HAD superfamily
MRLPSRRLRGLLVDLDGTLVDRDEALRGWLRRRAGLSGRELDELLAIDAAESGLLAEFAIALLRARPGLARDPFALARRIRDELPAELRPDPAIARALDRLAGSGLRLALISNGGPGQRRKLEHARLPLDRFAAIVISSEVGLAKPDPRIFALALQRLGLESDEVLMVGDSPEHDIAGARAAGIASCWIGRGRRWPEAIERPGTTVGGFAELPATLAAMIE